MKLAMAGLLAATLAACDEDDGSPGPTDGGLDAMVLPDTGLVECVTAPFATIEGCAPGGVGTSFECDGQGHVEDEADAHWDANPPHSGLHYFQWETVRGEHEEVVSRARWVHNLEHGWVVFLYNCPAGCENELDTMRGVLLERPEARIILTPDPLLDPPRFAAVSWTWVYETDAPDLATLVCFVDQHEGQAPEDIP